MRPRDGLLLAAALASGAAALAYDLLWTRLLALSLGSEAVGLLAALAGFFGGLALGAAALHRRARDARDPVRLFIALELVAAGYAIASPHLLHALAHAVPAWLGPLAAAGGPAALAASTALAALVLLPGSAPLGASLAALVEARRRACPEDQDTRGLGRVYAANTIGAALAALAAIHLLFPALGYSLGALASAGLGLAAALAARAWARGRDLSPRPPAAAALPDASRDPDPDLLREPWLLSLLAFGLGLGGVGLQVVGVRVLGQHAENTIYTFAHTVAVYLVASGLGAAAYQRLARTSDPPDMSHGTATSGRAAAPHDMSSQPSGTAPSTGPAPAASRARRGPLAGRPASAALALLWLLAVLVVPAALALGLTPEVLAPGEHPTFAGAALAELLAAALVFGPSAFVMGALLSHVLGLVAATGRGVGRAYALNALGCALAPFVFGLWAIPRLGYADALYLVLYLDLALFGVFGWFRRFSPVVLISAILGGVALTAAGPRSLVLVEPADGWVRLTTRIKDPATGAVRDEPAERQTIFGVVALSEQRAAGPVPGKPTRRLQIDHKFRMGGAAAFGEQRMGQVCSILSHASGPEGPIPRALYLGLGTGATMGGALQIPHAAAEGVELVPEVLEFLPEFSDINHDLARRPEAALVAADARRYLAAARGSYDLIVADLFHPGQDGASNLFSRDHFAAAREHLRPGGLMCQWLPLYQLDEASARAVVRAFLDVFPESRAFLGIYNAHNPALALVGRAPDPAAQGLRLSVPRLAADTKADVVFIDPRDLLASHILGPDELATWAGDARPNTDLDPQLAFRAARVAYADDPTVGPRNLAVLLERAAPAPAALLTGEGAAELAAATLPFTEATRHYLRGELARGELSDLSAMSWETAEHYLRAYEAEPAFPPARGALYNVARKNPGLAARLLPRMLARTPDEPRVRVAYLQHLRAVGDASAYEQLRQETAAAFPDLPLP